MSKIIVMAGVEPAGLTPRPQVQLPAPPGMDLQTARTGVWRQVVLARAAAIRAELAVLPDADPGTVRQVIDLVEIAETAATTGKSGLRAWWSGSLTERSWLSLHTADALLLRLESDSGLVARLPEVVGFAARHLPDQDPTLCRVRHRLAWALDEPWTVGRALAPSDRRLVEELLRTAYAAADQEYAASRSFRNRLVRVTVALVVLLGLIFLVAALSHTSFPGIPGPPWKDVLVVGVFGAAGAVITAVRPLAESGGTYNPFSLPSWQGTVKVFIGVVSAILGVLAISAGVVPGVVVSNPADAVFWAVVFGASQQALTSTVDARVQQLTRSSRPVPSAECPSGPGHDLA